MPQLGWETCRPYKADLSRNWIILRVSCWSNQAPRQKPVKGSAVHRYWRVSPKSAIGLFLQLFRFVSQQSLLSLVTSGVRVVCEDRAEWQKRKDDWHSISSPKQRDYTRLSNTSHKLKRKYCWKCRNCRTSWFIAIIRRAVHYGMTLLHPKHSSESKFTPWSPRETQNKSSLLTFSRGSKIIKLYKVQKKLVESSGARTKSSAFTTKYEAPFYR